MEENKMPEILNQFLSDLQSAEEIDAICLWLDSNPNAISEMINLLATLKRRGNAIKSMIGSKLSQATMALMLNVSQGTVSLDLRKLNSNVGEKP